MNRFDIISITFIILIIIGVSVVASLYPAKTAIVIILCFALGWNASNCANTVFSNKRK